jgi:hypothetical protein
VELLRIVIEVRLSMSARGSWGIARGFERLRAPDGKSILYWGTFLA